VPPHLLRRVSPVRSIGPLTTRGGVFAGARDFSRPGPH